MAESIDLELGEVRSLPPRKHSATTPLVVRTDEVVGTGQELLVVTPGKNGIKLIPYGSTFLDYEPNTSIPIFELPDGTTTDWHERAQKTTEEETTT